MTDEDWGEKVRTAKAAWELGRRTMIPQPLRQVPGSRLTERQDQPGSTAGSLLDDSEAYQIVKNRTTDKPALHGARMRDDDRERQSSTPESDLQISSSDAHTPRSHPPVSPALPASGPRTPNREEP